ncbi:hypothetical protein VaNZ11_013313 [Volvox africanus]|uniref:Uncharacterized protein n=1 Tax=Volvox africanus TaxID=51714 RepID=A0ABQ5SHY3_9CHLO|nr:hypothetical protein VaNZ11_013313 [Volvox africanus]
MAGSQWCGGAPSPATSAAAAPATATAIPHSPPSVANAGNVNVPPVLPAPLKGMELRCRPPQVKAILKFKSTDRRSSNSRLFEAFPPCRVREQCRQHRWLHRPPRLPAGVGAQPVMVRAIQHFAVEHQNHHPPLLPHELQQLEAQRRRFRQHLGPALVHTLSGLNELTQLTELKMSGPLIARTAEHLEQRPRYPTGT